jgi:glycosyltransferase involved in cell wall biosynthesis
VDTKKVGRAKVRVANVIEDGRIAGPQIRMAEVAKHLVLRGVRTVLIMPELDSGLFKERAEAAGVAYRTFHLHRPVRDSAGLIRYVLTILQEILALYRHFRSARYDVVHCSGGAWQVKGLIAGKLSGAKVVWHLNDTLVPRVIKGLFKILSRFADAFIVAGTSVRTYYFNHVPVKKPIYEVQAPVDCSRFEASLVQPDARLSGGHTKVVMVTNINPLKGIEYFISMAAILSADTPDSISFHVFGPVFLSQAGYVRKLKAMVEERRLKNLYFMGPIADVRPALKAADVYVCSSVAEASPIAVWEAMAMEKAIVSTDVGDVRRFLGDGPAGYIVPPRDPVALAQAVGRLITDRMLREELGRRARDVALRHLDIGVCCDRHLQVYGSLLGRKTGEA